MIDSVQQEERSEGKEVQREAGEMQDEGPNRVADNRQGGCRGTLIVGDGCHPRLGSTVG